MAVSDKSTFSGKTLGESSDFRSNIVMAGGLVMILATLLVKMPTPVLDMMLANPDVAKPKFTNPTSSSPCCRRASI